MRLHIIAEGRTEETFVKDLIAVHLGSCGIGTDVRCVQTGRGRLRIHRGGVVSYHKARFDVMQWIKQDSSADCRFTTMFDYYALPHDFPGFTEASKVSDPYKKIQIIETAFGNDISDSRFIPYIQLHEFEALLFADIRQMETAFIGQLRAIQSLVKILDIQTNPELINDDPETAPSKRIVKHIPGYDGRKASAGPLVAEKIGLSTIRSKCRHFDEWLTRLENLKQ